jgi:DNA invertase Pin-like site-specific DNA recombinase
MARTLVGSAECERELIGERLKAGLAAKKRRFESIGREPQAQPAVVRRIVKCRPW